MKLLLKLLLLIGALIVVGGCSIFQSNADLITPPQLPLAKEELRIAIEKYLPENVELLTPLNNEDGSPIELIDLDGDQVNEAVAFYKSQQQSNLIKGIVLKDINGWTKVMNIDGEGRILVDLAFYDLNQDGILEILAGYAYTEDSEDYGLLVYDISSGSKPKILLDKPYSYLLVDQFSKDKNSLVLIKFNRGQHNTVYLYENLNSSIVERDHLELDSYINGYYSYQSGQISNTEHGLMLDAGVGAHSAQTFVISIKNGKLTNLFSGSEDPTFKASAVVSTDTNNDGILEYGVLEEPYMEELLPYATTPYITTHYQLNDNWNSEVVSKAYYDYEHLFRVDIPLDWPRIQIDRSDDRRHLEIKPAGTEVVFFDVYITKNKKAPNDDWHVIAETDEYLYLTKTTKNNNRLLFHLIEPLDLIN
ncbi:hypothetical protein [Paucisalibacillus sp. EB02]|uniref:hypothetical protein n=1 Tax=Paucisalibacillus sp. EB02 TaxID=1347087 RepID=UPI0004BB8F1C|nr:hypothetical protein [Paucisalibacillus sp. EB02]